jgi:hypothetical protein
MSVKKNHLQDTEHHTDTDLNRTGTQNERALFVCHPPVENSKLFIMDPYPDKDPKFQCDPDPDPTFKKFL